MAKPKNIKASWFVFLSVVAVLLITILVRESFSPFSGLDIHFQLNLEVSTHHEAEASS